MRKLLVLLTIASLTVYGTCGYTFKDVSIPPEVKTVRVNFIENRARIVNPQLSPQLTDRLRDKIIGQTRLTIVNSAEADYEISATITDYSVTVSGISGRQTTSNNLNISLHIVLKNRLDDKKSFETDVTRNFPFPGTQTLTQVQASLLPDILRNLSDDIFNKIFSNW